MLSELDSATSAWEAERGLVAAHEHPGLLGCFPQQRAFIEDESSFQVAFCTRRAAKSYSAGLKAFRKALKIPRCAVLIAGLARLEVKRIWWEPILKRIDRELDLHTHFNETELTARLPNGSIIYLLGMDANEKEKRKALGQKFPLVIIDEAQDFVTDLNALVFHVLKPAVADYRGSICMLGTPGLIAKGLFYDATKPLKRDTMWAMHEWTTFDNSAPSAVDPARTCAQEWSDDIDQLKQQKPGIELTPAFRRNYLREWVIDESALVYRYQPDRNDFDELPVYPNGEWHYVLASDLGFDDATSWVDLAYHDHDPCLYVLSAEKQPGLDVTGVAVRTKAKMKIRDYDAMVVDGANKQAVQEMVVRHEIPWRTADKTGKADFIEIMNGEFIIARIKLKRGAATEPLRAEYQTLIWDQKKADKGKREEHDACENHCTDGALYGWRHCFQFLSKAPVELPPSGSSAWQLAQDEEMRAARIEALEKSKREWEPPDDGPVNPWENA